MKTSSTHFTILFCIAGLALIFYNCSGKSAQAHAEELPTPENQTLVAEADSSAQPIAEAGETPTAEEEAAPEPAPAATNSGSGLSDHEVSEGRLATVLENVARNMEADSLEYKSSLGQDCSGIYHQIKDSVQVRISALRDKSKYIYPSFKTDRNSRQIAHWYHRHNNLHIVQNAMADLNIVKPGCVVFFGRTDEKYTNLDIDLLTNPDGNFVHSNGKGKIMHVAVVTSVEKDDAGNVTAYTMMHGRNSRHYASRTGGNCDCPKRGLDKQHSKFPFGNWNQQWVAIANIETPVQ